MDLDRILDSIRAEMARRHMTQRQMERELGYGTGYLSQVLGGRLDLKVKVFLEVLELLGITPVEFFASFESGQVGGPRTGGKRLVSPETLQRMADLLEEAGRQARALTEGTEAPRPRRESGGNG